MRFTQMGGQSQPPQRITNFREVLEFLTFILSRVYEELSPSQIATELAEYEISGVCRCALSFNQELICGTFYLRNFCRSQGPFEPRLLNSNLGLFIVHTNQDGCLSEMECFYEKLTLPKFYTKLWKAFLPSFQYQNLMKKLEQANLKLSSFQELKTSFKNANIIYLT